ncbi:MAG: AraC family transcriptional regulator ligand-binding domain-containing protein [Oleiphilaceae bacterium]|nr:AraC family transcriptional regulator ligand-binding domain-containing protein [Oleiphilaceae bacterium]
MTTASHKPAVPSQIKRVTGAWTGVLRDWLDQQNQPAPQLRAALARYAGDDRVPVPVWRQLLAQGLALAPEQGAPELDVGAVVQPSHLGVLGYLVLASETLGDAMVAYQRYERLFYGVSLADIELRQQEAEIRWPATSEPLGQQADGVAIAALVTFLRRQLHASPPPTAIAFRGRVTDSQARAYEVFFGCPVRFGDSHVRVCFPLESLQLSMPRRDPTLRRLLDRQAQALLRALPADAPMAAQLQPVLLRLLATGEPTLARAARSLHMAPRTLQRRLASQGLSWQQWLDRSREQLARDYLKDPGLSLTDIALLLGFSEQSAFTRAYRRWTGGSPGKDRASLAGVSHCGASHPAPSFTD